ncbi:HIT family protein [Arcanobacterium haemolyticum]|nr:HIT family protein [Arcanobacterium haemolyticum]
MSVFSKIISGEFSGRFAYADERCAVFATIEPHAHGHLLVVPRQEVDKITDLPEELVGHLMRVAHRIGRAQERAFPGRRAMYVVAGLGVPHTHIHVIPAQSESDLNFANAMHDLPGDVLDSDVKAVRSALVDLGFGEFVPKNLHKLA